MLILAPYPLEDSKQAGGLSQRVLAIDSVFLNTRRTYVSCSFTKNVVKKRKHIFNNCSLLEINFFFHFFLLLKLVTSTKIVYSHTIGNAAKVIPFIFLFRRGNSKGRVLICDMHGVVPEECQMYNKKVKALFFKIVEKIVVEKSSYIVCVSNNMIDHFSRKYPSAKNKAFILPIFRVGGDEFECERKVANAYESIKIIYAGGTQPWQNFDEMLSIARKCLKKSDSGLKLSFEFWLPEKDREKYERLERSSESISFYSGSLKDVIRAYSTSSFGFILRDDDLINKVACPTKLIEYLQHDIIPIVKSNNIGDFNDLGMEYISVEELLALDFNRKCFERMIIRNREVFGKHCKHIEDGISKVKELVDA
ncbi:MAG: glycosyltransferase family 4 protein [Gammaproteobacteria bacterium]|nr:glycosyltransferase family 4 protein [Gammaproteobacteria bacterium]